MNVIGIDPGPERSAFALWDGEHFIDQGWPDNETLLSHIKGSRNPGHMIVEKVVHYGKRPVGADVFETAYWTGRFIQAWLDRLTTQRTASRISFSETAIHHCRTTRVDSAVIRQALIDRFGPGDRKAIGLKAHPGPLYGMKGEGGHKYDAAAIALVAWDRAEAAKDGVIL